MRLNLLPAIDIASSHLGIVADLFVLFVLRGGRREDGGDNAAAH